MQVCTQNCIGCSKNKHRNDEDKKNLIKRLNRVEGQVRGISKMVEEDRYCEDVLIQISAVINSLRSMSNEMLKSHLSTCVVDEITAIPLLSTHFYGKVASDWVTVSPDHGGVNRARKVAERLNTPIAIIDKRRSKPNEAEVMHIIGDIKDKHCVMIDDIIDTAGSCSEGARALLKAGAKSVRIAATHGIFSSPARERMIESDLFEEIVVTDSIPLKDYMKCDKVTVLSLAPMLAKIIEHIELGLPLTYVYDMFVDKI